MLFHVYSHILAIDLVKNAQPVKSKIVHNLLALIIKLNYLDVGRVSAPICRLVE